MSVGGLIFTWTHHDQQCVKHGTGCVYTIKRRRDFFTSRLRLRRCEVIKMDSKDNQPMDRYPALTAPLLLSLRLALSTLPLYVNIPRILHRQAGNAFGLFLYLKIQHHHNSINSTVYVCAVWFIVQRIINWPSLYRTMRKSLSCPFLYILFLWSNVRCKEWPIASRRGNRLYVASSILSFSF